VTEKAIVVVKRKADTANVVVSTRPSSATTAVIATQASGVAKTEEKQVVVVERQKTSSIVTCGTQGPPGVGGGVAIDDDNPTLTTTFSGTHIMELLFPFALSSFSASPSVVEMGGTVTQVQFSWATNYPPDTVSINNGVGSIALPATTHLATGLSLTASTTFTLTATRNAVPKTANASVSFQNRVYYGVHTSQTIDENIIDAMTNLLSSTRARTITFDCTGGRFFHYAYPTRLGAAGFQINNLTYSDVTRTTVSFTNASGFTEDYYVYYCNVIQNGAAIPLVVS
jgi:hypothetical protein